MDYTTADHLDFVVVMPSPSGDEIADAIERQVCGRYAGMRVAVDRCGWVPPGRAYLINLDALRATGESEWRWLRRRRYERAGVTDPLDIRP